MIAARIMGALLFGALFTSSCTPSAESRHKTIEQLTIISGYRPIEITTKPYYIKAWGKNIGGSRTLRIYIEGDGFAWRNAHTPSKDPTPITPMSLKLAAEDPTKSILYLARPCQYYKASYCTADLWTDARYSKAALDSYLRLLDGVKKQHHIEQFELVGYSGGGVMAALIAAHRTDVANLRTIASPLDIAAWTREKGYRLLKGSLNPALFAQELSTIPQIHFLGENDEIVPKNTLKAYASRLASPNQCVKTQLIKGTSHHKRIVNKWVNLISKAPACTIQAPAVAN